MADFESLKHEIKILVLKGFNNAKRAHEEIFSERCDITVIVGHLSIANAQVYAAKSIYVCNESLSHSELDDFFHRFRVFSDEVMTNIRTDRSHQWSDIEFERLHEAYLEAARLLEIAL